ncbi:RNA-binding S4 domain-containing protein [Neoroseomonas oryzicola]|uniref:RNA-binding S4 domain-containing protein n=1 Tax=Neoroseomonas oryzicola TaxID=535904 RepID=A0A9X9WQT2_9PROT|nr:RNA-binding S4 domain-containing protein [Neoroseomonas oryzicola]MBR0662692.1 RNA-binding S4 domain-containing protein [Neoroseomonas oryzicola]NKE19467.1 RNA-binding S4 domain-containing protein [Neoroseomonas oryzicola]
MPPEDFQRLDAWLWCARLRKTRSDCAALVESGAVRINRQPTDKPHARVRIGDVLTIAQGHGERGRIAVWRVLALAERRGPPAEARLLFEDLSGDMARD